MNYSQQHSNKSNHPYMIRQKLIFTNNVAQAIDTLAETISSPKVFVLVDVNTQQLVLPELKSTSETIANATVITINAGDVNKNLDTLAYIWKQLCDNGATRKSLLINLGGGVVTDIGAFAGATFKRGIRFLNVPTTLLAAVDAAVGGKTGINFNGFKNEIGAFREADAVIISTTFFKTLPHEELLSGYAEMIKHGLISDKTCYNRLLAYDISSSNDHEHLLQLLEESVNVKRHIVEKDPTEKGIRRALNLGHTAGHAFESLAMKRNAPIPHGYAVAWGLVVEAVLSHLQLKFPSDELHRLARYISNNYGAINITCDDYPELLNLMHHDKKNDSTEINFTLLTDVGSVHIDCTASEEEIKTALDIFRDLLGI